MNAHLEQMAFALRVLCGHDSRSVDGCVTCEAADMLCRCETVISNLVESSRSAIPFLRDEAEKYEDDGSNEPLETLRDLRSAIALAGNHTEIKTKEAQS